MDLYEREYAPKRPVVRCDEMPYQLMGETRQQLPAEPGKPQRYDYEYQRMGTTKLFIHLEPKAGRRHVEVTDTRTSADFAGRMKRLVDERYLEAELIRAVLDQWNTHTGASLYEAYEPAEARRIADKLRVPSHTQARLVAQSSRDRVERTVGAVSGQAYPGRGYTQS